MVETCRSIYAWSIVYVFTCKLLQLGVQSLLKTKMQFCQQKCLLVKCFILSIFSTQYGSDTPFREVSGQADICSNPANDWNFWSFRLEVENIKQNMYTAQLEFVLPVLPAPMQSPSINCQLKHLTTYEDVLDPMVVSVPRHPPKIERLPSLKLAVRTWKCILEDYFPFGFRHIWGTNC